MYKSVNIGEKVVNLLANAATPVRYKMVFRQDLMVELNQINKATRDDAEVTDIISRLAYVMARQADSKDENFDMGKANADDYIDWLEEFGPTDFLRASEAIIELYFGDMRGNSKPKKGKGRQTEN